MLQQVLPVAAPIGDVRADRAAVLAALAELYPFPDGAWVRACMISTLDGSSVGADRLSGSISGPADRAVLSTLRGLCDVVLAGAGTVRQEDYLVPAPKPEFAQRRRLAGQHPAPPLAIVTRTGKVPRTAVEPGSGLIVTCASAPIPFLRNEFGADAVIVAGDDEVDLAAAITALSERGLRKVQLEGGPTLLGQALGAGVVHELCLTLSPMLVTGDGPRIAHAPHTLPAHSWRLAHLLTDGAMLMLRYVR